MSWSEILLSLLLSYYEKEKGVFMRVEFEVLLMGSHMKKYVQIKVNTERGQRKYEGHGIIKYLEIFINST